MICHDCKKPIVPPASGGLGYGVDSRNRKVCYACCAEQDKEQMRKTGRATLYLVQRLKDSNGGKLNVWLLTNWPGSLEIQLHNIRFGHHNIAGKRYDVWFCFEGRHWHGVTYGDNTQLCHCRRCA